jgi:Ca2+-binding EF-hand superfamily protein
VVAELAQGDIGEEMKDELNEAWGLYDKNNSGSMPAKNFGYVMRYLGQNPSDAQVLDMCQKNGSGVFLHFLC